MSATNADDRDAAEMLHRKMDVEIAKLIAETGKIIAETSRINREWSSHPWVPNLTTTLGSTGVIGTIVALLIAFHK